MPHPRSIRYTISDAIANFLLDRQSKKRSANTVRYYKDELHQLELYTGPGDMSMITANLLRRYFVDMTKKRSDGGIHCLYRAVSAFLNWFDQETDGEYNNPIKRVRIPAPKRKPLPGVTIEDARKMLDACVYETGRHPLAARDATIIRVLLDTGVRAFELRALNLGDVDPVAGRIIVRHGKGDKERVVFVEQSTRRSLRKYLRGRNMTKLDEPLFLTDAGRRISKRGLENMIEKVAIRAKVKSPGLHDFRRAFAKNMHANGVDILHISRLMGHGTLEQTKAYIAEDEADLRQAHAKGSPVDNAGL